MTEQEKLTLWKAAQILRELAEENSLLRYLAEMLEELAQGGSK